MWREAYLETCCRSALHRLALAGRGGRPPDGKDGPCLSRLEAKGFARLDADSRFSITEDGIERHLSEIGPLPGLEQR